MINKYRLFSLIFISALAGCATQPATLNYEHVQIIPSDEAKAHPDYEKHFHQCDWYATSNQTDLGRSALTGAAAGAGLASLFGLILGVDSGYGQLAGIGALSGGLSTLGGAAISNDMRYKQIMTQCLRDKGHHVY